MLNFNASTLILKSAIKVADKQFVSLNESSEGSKIHLFYLNAISNPRSRFSLPLLIRVLFG